MLDIKFGNMELLHSYQKHGLNKSKILEVAGGVQMRRELGIARCGLACCLCTENADCNGCDSNSCPDNDFCENKKCSIAKELTHCYKCEETCKKGLLSKIKPYTFNLFAKKYGEEKLLDCLERNEKNGVVYHRDGINGDYDDFDDVDQLMNFILTGVR